MGDLNNDKDNLFQDAAEQYPLKTDDSNWEKVLAGLHDGNATAPVAADNKKRNKRLLWLLLLLPLPLLYLFKNNHTGANNKQSAIINKTEHNRIYDSISSDHKKMPETVTQPQVFLPENKMSNAVSDAHKKPETASAFQYNNTKNADKENAIIKKYTNRKKAIDAFDNDNKTNGESEAQRIEKNKPDDKKNNDTEKQPAELLSRIQNKTSAYNNKNIREAQKQVSSDPATKNIVDDAVAKHTDSTNKKKNAKITETQQRKGFYAGLSGSFDLSNVKLQRINKAGYGLNALAGYRFSKHLSAETGISLSRKNYYSDGKYFDKKKAKIPDVVNIYYSNGYCNMLEVPVNVKYDFAFHKKSNLFATAGFNSYIMKKESYFYRGDYNMMRVYDTTRNYRNSGSNLFSVAGFSIGYELYLNQKSALRVEPYIKVPLHGIGIANMPIMSTGISVGFTRKF